MLEFIRQYIEGYDQDDRSPLTAAYHPNSMFSMSAVYPAGTTAHGGSKLTHYQVDARNLNLILQPNKRMTFLKLGHENVIKFLNDLPKTKHDLNSFTLGKSNFFSVFKKTKYFYAMPKLEFFCDSHNVF